MAVSVTHTQVRSVQPGPLYRVQDTCTAGVGIEKEAFVFAVLDDSFQHVATVDNMLNLPNTKAAAQLANLDYYRDDVVVRDHTSLSLAEDFAATINARLKSLVVQYDVAVNAFVGTTTSTVSS